MGRTYNLNPAEISDVVGLCHTLSQLYSSVEGEEFLGSVNLHAHELPLNVRKFLNDFRLSDEDSDYAVVTGFPIDEGSIGYTPSHWDNRPAVSPTLKEEIYAMLLGALVGDAFGWATQQAGYICHDLLPVKGLEMEQTGASSKCVLDWHTEDAFHPCRGDYVQLLCLRNPDNTPTTIGALDLGLLSDEETELLFQPRFAFKPDHSHTQEFRGRDEHLRENEKDRLEVSYSAMNRMDTEPPLVPILSGRPDAPFICIDPVFMNRPSNHNAAAAFDALRKALDHNLMDVALNPGDVVFVDNARVIHGRKPFLPRYDGTDRWLKRFNLTTDLHKSFPLRVGDSRRLIF
ncbi:MAG: TauD/TfdA family dioxygenase [Rhodospirillales bacterium]|nr:TauD/TfdA family dioxygenase [Rhodospirillales bacterium]